MPRQYLTVLTFPQTRLVRGADETTFDLPYLANGKQRRIHIDVSGWRYDDSTNKNNPDNLYMGSRECVVTREWNSDAPVDYAASVASGVTVNPTEIVAKGGGAYGPCDKYDPSFGNLADGAVPLTVAYVPGAGGIGADETAGYDQITLAFSAGTADQDLVATLAVSYYDVDLELIP